MLQVGRDRHCWVIVWTSSSVINRITSVFLWLGILLFILTVSHLPCVPSAFLTGELNLLFPTLISPGGWAGDLVLLCSQGGSTTCLWLDFSCWLPRLDAPSPWGDAVTYFLACMQLLRWVSYGPALAGNLLKTSAALGQTFKLIFFKVWKDAYTYR